jgi:hypothetical protein
MLYDLLVQAIATCVAWADRDPDRGGRPADVVHQVSP